MAKLKTQIIVGLIATSIALQACGDFLTEDQPYGPTPDLGDPKTELKQLTGSENVLPVYLNPFGNLIVQDDSVVLNHSTGIIMGYTDINEELEFLRNSVTDYTTYNLNGQIVVENSDGVRYLLTPGRDTYAIQTTDGKVVVFSLEDDQLSIYGEAVSELIISEPIQP